MAKEDFCFTYYDGDAASDMQHMNRLERGAYSDLILFQRKIKKHLNVDQIRKVLGRDFEACWPAIELILKTDGDGGFFVEWLEKSEIKAKKHSRKQSGNRAGKTKVEPDLTKQQPNVNQTKPLGDGDGDGIEVKYELKELEKKEVFQIEIKDETLAEVTWWTNEVITGNDFNFKPPENVPMDDVYTLAMDHLGKCARYGWHEKLTSQQAFRESLKNFIRENYKKPNDKTPKTTIEDRKRNFK